MSDCESHVSSSAAVVNFTIPVVSLVSKQGKFLPRVYVQRLTETLDVNTCLKMIININVLVQLLAFAYNRDCRMRSHISKLPYLSRVTALTPLVIFLMFPSLSLTILFIQMAAIITLDNNKSFWLIDISRNILGTTAVRKEGNALSIVIPVSLVIPSYGFSIPR
jgi:hypothetical protein